MTNEERFAAIPKPTMADITLASVDNIGNPHLYCITPKHFVPGTMYMNGDTIQRAEKEQGAVCDTCKYLKRKYNTPILGYTDHKERNILFINVQAKGRKPSEIPDFPAYLKSIADTLVELTIEGVSLIDTTKPKAKSKK